ncbi:glyoxylase-like metal-dependent hydrolase (beta-lactamase superfamily II) [Virgibacillus natechei]|uniref:Glyoxylase-like metal-dependent hydrolase (Beta-lactamase superfamily II) n=1 Tax=Virgibacillus natechei TaxID=1216297 RepID=A0ABS4IBY1_9BACI|nr:MBL fold metallo-hydrolase [Virgibacillus natechei]MBP1968437.1 glyoxylase-like metal-dependent hydrolase (beta-lactamase superfamily II) [Virgibacillus natechei]UZD14839.1 MBL fold metallo-hydrolase [Virgibacillus natechei]
MQKKDPIQLDNRIHLIDGFDLDVPDRTGSYVIDEEALTIVETGPSPSIKHVKEGLKTLGFSLDQVKYIIVTHIHLDHAGGAGLLVKECPNATVVVHPRGERHLVNPKKLAAGARAIYGESFSDLFDPIIPVPEERLLVKGEGDTLQIGSACTLEFLDTPGHSKHHFSIYDPISKGMFTGDTVGIRYEQLIREGIDLFLPSTSPNQFDPNAMQASIDRMMDMKLERIYFGHFGMTEKTDQALDQVSEWLDIFVEEGERVVSEGKGYDVLAKALLGRVRHHLREFDIPDEHEAYIVINLDMQVSALGIMDYFKKLKQ